MKKIKLIKNILLLYWATVLIALIFFCKTNFGFYYVVVGIILLLIHIGEIFFFKSTLEKYSTNLNRDRLLMLPFGLLVLNELKFKNKIKDKIL